MKNKKPGIGQLYTKTPLKYVTFGMVGGYDQAKGAAKTIRKVGKALGGGVKYVKKSYGLDKPPVRSAKK